MSIGISVTCRGLIPYRRNVKGTDTIRSLVLNFLADNEEISANPSDVVMFYSSMNKELRHSLTFQDYGIRSGDVINVRELMLPRNRDDFWCRLRYFELFASEPFAEHWVELKKSAKPRELVAKALRKLKVPLPADADTILFYGGERLLDGETLVQQGVKGQSTVHVLLKHGSLCAIDATWKRAHEALKGKPGFVESLKVIRSDLTRKSTDLRRSVAHANGIAKYVINLEAKAVSRKRKIDELGEEIVVARKASKKAQDTVASQNKTIGVMHSELETTKSKVTDMEVRKNIIRSELIEAEILKHQELKKCQDELKAAKIEKQMLEKDRLCVVCYERPKDHVVIPCWHLSVCEECCSRLHQCPMCREQIESTQKVFV